MYTGESLIEKIGLDWKKTESSARRVANLAAELLNAQPDPPQKMKIVLWSDKHEIEHQINWLPSVGDIIYLSEECEFSEWSGNYCFKVTERLIWDDNYKPGLVEVSIKVKIAYRGKHSVPPKYKK